MIKILKLFAILIGLVIATLLVIPSGGGNNAIELILGIIVGMLLGFIFIPSFRKAIRG